MKVKKINWIRQREGVYIGTVTFSCFSVSVFRLTDCNRLIEIEVRDFPCLDVENCYGEIDSAKKKCQNEFNKYLEMLIK